MQGQLEIRTDNGHNRIAESGLKVDSDSVSRHLQSSKCQETQRIGTRNILPSAEFQEAGTLGEAQSARLPGSGVENH